MSAPSDTGPERGVVPHPSGWSDLIKWILDDHRRAAWALAFVVPVLSAAVATAALLGPYVGDLAGLVSGGLVGGGLALSGSAFARRRSNRDSVDE